MEGADNERNMLLTALDINAYSKMNEFIMKNIIYCTAFDGNVYRYSR